MHLSGLGRHVQACGGDALRRRGASGPAPELLFTLRGVDSAELIASAGDDGALYEASASSQRILAADDVAALFGIEMAPPPVASAPPPKKAGKRARKRRPPGARKAAKETLTKLSAPRSSLSG